MYFKNKAVPAESSFVLRLFSAGTAEDSESIIVQPYKGMKEKPMRSSLATRVLIPEQEPQVEYLGQNKHQHHVFMVLGEKRSGFEEIINLGSLQWSVSNSAQQCLLNESGDDGYNMQHQLSTGSRHQIALVRAEALHPSQTERCTQYLHRFAEKKFGYSKLRAGVIPGMCGDEVLNFMRMQGLLRLIGVHTPILDEESSPNMLGIGVKPASPKESGGGIYAHWSAQDNVWPASEIFAFAVLKDSDAWMNAPARLVETVARSQSLQTA